MSNEKMVTERDAILRQRAAFVVGWADHGGSTKDGWERVRIFYPLPKVTRPRVVKDPSDSTTEWKVENNALVWRAVPEFPTWYGVSTWHPTPERVKMWADLLANPLEEVEE